MLLVQPITVRHFSDPGCPWAYSASPALAMLRWRYGAQLDWKLTLIGLTERSQQYVDRGYTPQRQARGYRNFRQYGMPFQTQPKHHVAATSRACRAVVAARIQDPALGERDGCREVVVRTEDDGVLGVLVGQPVVELRDGGDDLGTRG